MLNIINWYKPKNYIIETIVLTFMFVKCSLKIGKINFSGYLNSKIQ